MISKYEPSELRVNLDLCHIDLQCYPDIILHLFAKFQRSSEPVFTLVYINLCLQAYVVTSWNALLNICSEISDILKYSNVLHYVIVTISR